MKHFFLIVFILETLPCVHSNFPTQNIIFYALILFAELELFGFNWFDYTKSNNVEIVWSDFLKLNQLDKTKFLI
jgi:hypothetical protein